VHHRAPPSAHSRPPPWRCVFFYLLLRPPPRSALFPYTTLFRSDGRRRCRLRHQIVRRRPEATTAAPSRKSRGQSHNHETAAIGRDRKSTRLNSSHRTISYAVFCLKKKNEMKTTVADSPTVSVPV